MREHEIPHLTIPQEACMTIEELRKKKKELGLTNERISEISKVPVSTVQKIFGGATGRPREETLRRLERALIKTEIDRKLAPYEKNPYDSMWVKETNALDLYDQYFATVDYPFEPIPGDMKAPDKKQGEYTLQDFYAMPPDRKVELIDGVIYDKAEPTDVHQLIIGALYYDLNTQIMEKDLDCIPFGASIDVRLNRDNKTMVEPDIVVMCGEHYDADAEEDQAHTDNQIENGLGHSSYMLEEDTDEDYDNSNIPLAKRAHRFYDGPPDLVVEVLSPSNRDYDCSIKLKKYMSSGVREYWIVDPELERIVVHMSDRAVVCLYTFNDIVPVTISGGAVEIDFSKIRKTVHRQLDILLRTDRRTRDLYR